MRISGINIHNYINRHNSNNRTSYCHQPLLNIYATDTVSFSSHRNRNLFIKDAREIEDLPCACCGKPMKRNSAVQKFLDEKLYFPASVSLHLMKEQGFKPEEYSADIQNAYNWLVMFANKKKGLTLDFILTLDTVKDYRRKLSPSESKAFDEIKEMSKMIARPSSYMVKEIQNLNLRFPKTEKQVFNELKELSKIYPDETFHQILNKPEIKQIYLNNLLVKQLNILKEIQFMSKELPRRYQFELKDVCDMASDIFTNEDASVKHKRKRVVYLVEHVLDRIRNNKHAKAIIDKINTLPDSKTDVDAFMIKSSQNTSNSLAETLLNRVRNTREHVTPRNREGDNGENSIHNYIYMCGKCNNDRQTESYELVVNEHPDMPENAQRQMDTIISYVNKGLLIGYDDYPTKIKQKLHIESGGTETRKGKIELDISALDKLSAIYNRNVKKYGKEIAEQRKERYCHKNHL